MLQFRRKKTNWNANNKAIKDDVGSENHATGNGEGKRTFSQKKVRVDDGSQKGA